MCLYNLPQYELRLFLTLTSPGSGGGGGGRRNHRRRRRRRRRGNPSRSE